MSEIQVSPKLIPVIRIVNPFDPREFVRETFVWEQTKTLAEYFPLGTVEHVVSINGKPVEAEDFGVTYLDHTDNLVICPVPQGGGSGKTILRIVAIIAIIYFSYGTYGYDLAAGMAATTGMGTAAAWQAGMVMAGSMLVNALLPPPKPTQNQNGSDLSSSPTYGVDGAKNTSAENVSVPVCYGGYRMAGNMLGLFTENAGDTQYLYMLLNAGEGPVISLTDILINDQPLSSYKNVETMVREGRKDQTVIPWFADSITPRSVNRPMLFNVYVNHQTTTAVNRMRFDVVFPQGMFSVDTQTGARSAVSVDFSIEVRKVGTAGAWIDCGGAMLPNKHRVFHYGVVAAESPVLNPDTGLMEVVSLATVSLTLPPGYTFVGDDVMADVWSSYSGEGGLQYGYISTKVGYVEWVSDFETGINVTANSTSAVRRSYFSPMLDVGVYDARLKRITPDIVSDAIQDKIFISDINEIVLDDVAYVNTALVGLKIQLNDQLSGVPNVTFINGGRLVRTFNFATNVWEDRASKNPAWIVLDALTHTRYGASMSYSRFDMAMFKEWAQFCETNNLTFEAVIDTSMNVWDALQPVLRCGHAQIVNVGTRFTVVIERAAVPTMMFGVGNIIEGSFKETWLGVADRANEIDVTYFDRADNYKQRAIRVVDEAAMARGDKQRPSAITMVGIVDKEKAYKEGFFALNLNRYILQTIEFSAPMEAIACTVGDLIYVQHDMPQWGFAGRTELNSTVSNIVLDREVLIETGKQYKLLVKHDAIKRAQGAITSVVGNTLILSSGAGTSVVKRIKSNGIDRAVLSTFNGGATYSVTVESGTFLSGATYELWDTDVIEERDVVATPGTFTSVTLMSPFSEAPGQFLNWMFGEVTKVKKPFRVRMISGNHDYKRDLSCVEYNASCYDFTGMAAPTPNFSALPAAVAHVLYAGVTEEAIGSGGGVVTNVTVNFYSTSESYASSTVKVAVNGRAYETIATEAFSSASVYCQAGDNLIFKVIAKDTLGSTASEGSAPTLAHAVAGATRAAPVVTGLAVVMSGIGVTASWDRPVTTGAVDWTVTQVRVGASWEAGAVRFTGKATSANLGWLASGTAQIWVAHGNIAGVWSVRTNAQIVISPPLQPVIVGEVGRGEVTLTWQDCKASQPIFTYVIRKGATFATSVLLGQQDGTSFAKTEPVQGTFLYWVVATDLGGNESFPGYVSVTVLTTIDQAITQLNNNLGVAVGDINVDLNLLKLKDSFNSSIALVGVASEIVTRTNNDESLSQLITTVVATANTDRLNTFAGIENEATARASADGATATQISTVVATATSDRAAAVASVQTEATARAGETGQLFAKYGVTLSVGGKISGYRINNDSVAGSDFVILSDRFAVAQSVAGTTKYPFTIGLIDGIPSIGIAANMYVDGTITAGKLIVASLDAVSATMGNLRSGSVRAGQYADYAWPTTGGGYYLGPEGLKLGNANTGAYFEVTAAGNLYAQNFSIVNGTLTINQANVINTLNVAGNAITVPSAASTSGGIATNSSTGTAVQSLVVATNGSPVSLHANVTHSSNIDEQVYIGIYRNTLNIAGEVSLGVHTIKAGTYCLLALTGIDLTPPPGTHTYLLRITCSGASYNRVLTAINIKK